MNAMARLCVACAVLFFGASVAMAGGFKEYPNAKVDEKATKEANDLGAKMKGGKFEVPKATIYVTSDSYEKVYEFYKGVGKEYKMPNMSKNKLPSGKELKAAFFIFDGAKDMMSSKSWAKIQRPYIIMKGMSMEEGPDMTFIALSTKE
jgi:hypothetical protein